MKIQNSSKLTVLHGFYLGVHESSSGIFKWMRLKTVMGEAIIKVPKPMRTWLPRQLKLGTPMRIWAQQRPHYFKAMLVIPLDSKMTVLPPAAVKPI